MQGYFNGTLASLIGCVTTPTTSSTTLVETISTASSYFMCDKFI